MVNGIWGGAAPRDGEGYAGFVVRIGDRGVRGRGHWSASGGDGCAPTQRKGWGGFGGVSSPLVLPLGGGGVCIPCEGIAGEWLQLMGWGGGMLLCRGRGPCGPRGSALGSGRGSAPPPSREPFKGCGFLGAENGKSGH